MNIDTVCLLITYKSRVDVLFKYWDVLLTHDLLFPWILVKKS